jgi:hypothetical protein
MPTPFEKIALPGGRTAIAVPAEEAGEFRLVVQNVATIPRLLAIGCSQDEAEAGDLLDRTWRDVGLCGYDASAMPGGLRGGTSGDLVDHVDERAWVTYTWAMRVMRPHHRDVYSTVIDARAPRDLATVRAGLALLAAGLRASAEGRKLVVLDPGAGN